MKKIISLMAFLVFISGVTHAGTVILTTSHIDVEPKDTVYYNQMMVKTNQTEEFPSVVTSWDYTGEYSHLSQVYNNVSNFTIKWVGVNDIELKSFKQIDLTNCSFDLGANETKHVNIVISGSVKWSDSRAAKCQSASKS